MTPPRPTAGSSLDPAELDAETSVSMEGLGLRTPFTPSSSKRARRSTAPAPEAGMMLTGYMHEYDELLGEEKDVHVKSEDEYEYEEEDEDYVPMI